MVDIKTGQSEIEQQMKQFRLLNKSKIKVYYWF